MFVVATGRLQPPAFIINLPTKGHWKSRSRLSDIDTRVCANYGALLELEIASVAVPPLGCGLGGLSWSDVRPRIEDALADLPSRVLVYAPHGAPAP